MSGSLFAGVVLWFFAFICYISISVPEALKNVSVWCGYYSLVILGTSWLMACVSFTNARMATLEFHDKEREQESSRDHPRHPQPRLLLKG